MPPRSALATTVITAAVLGVILMVVFRSAALPLFCLTAGFVMGVGVGAYIGGAE
jgi:hypothetical protein